MSIAILLSILLSIFANNTPVSTTDVNAETQATSINARKIITDDNGG